MKSQYYIWQKCDKKILPFRLMVCHMTGKTNLESLVLTIRLPNSRLKTPPVINLQMVENLLSLLPWITNGETSKEVNLEEVKRLKKPEGPQRGHSCERLTYDVLENLKSWTWTSSHQLVMLNESESMILRREISFSMFNVTILWPLLTPCTIFAIKPWLVY